MGNTRDLQIVHMCSYENTKLVENTLPAENDCPWCDAKAGDTHARSCEHGERYKQAKEIRDAARDSARQLGRLGGLAKSEAKTQSSRENGKKGGRPRKEEKEIDSDNSDLFE